MKIFLCCIFFLIFLLTTMTFWFKSFGFITSYDLQWCFTFVFFYFGIVLQFFSSIIQIYLLSSIFFDSIKKEKNERKSAKAHTSKRVGIYSIYESILVLDFGFVYLFLTFSLLFTFHTMNKIFFDFAPVLFSFSRCFYFVEV